jgi:hypothetical protein
VIAVRIPNIFDTNYEVVSSELVKATRDINEGTGRKPDVRTFSYVVEIVRLKK